MTSDLNRRDFLLRGCSSLTAVWLSSRWPALRAAARHARESTQSPAPKLEFFTAEEAAEIDAITSRIIPTDDTPGAHEAGVVYFIDRALTTFFASSQETYRQGFPEFVTRAKAIFPALQKFSAATPEQLDEILHSFDEDRPSQSRPYGATAAAKNFFETLRWHTITAFLLDPDAGGDPHGIGWKLIGREREHIFQPPFGYYDKDYPGGQPISDGAGKAKS